MYVIAGVSGHTGSITAAALLAAGKPVRVIVRDAAKGAPWKARGAEVAVASLGDRDALARALTGATAAFVLLPPPAWGADGVAAFRRDTTAAIVGAVAAAKPGHVVLLSSIGANLPSGNGPIKSLYPLEHGLRETGVPATFLRAAYFLENWGGMLEGAIASGKLYYGTRVDVAFPQVATADIGALAARLLVEPAPNGARIVELAGPAELSLADVAATIARVSGKPVEAVEVPTAAMVESLVGIGAAREVADDYGEMASALGRGLLRWEAEPLRGTQTFETWLRAQR
ncbi:MAG: NmrA family NAD(P)-binding protein [Kofleriaceae bacterium]